MSTDLTIRPLTFQPVEYNKLELAAAVQAIAARYEGVVVTDKATAKRDRAEANRILKQIDDARKAVKRQYEVPLKAFEADIKTIVEPLKASVNAIDVQIKAIEEQERADRRELLIAAYNASNAANVTFERIFDPSWLNASISESKTIGLLNDAVDRAEQDIAIIAGLNSKHEAALIDRYNHGATLAEVMQYKTDLDAQAPVAPVQEQQAVPDDNPLNVYTITPEGVTVSARQQTYSLTMTCSPARFEMACDALNRLGIFYIVED